MRNALILLLALLTSLAPAATVSTSFTSATTSVAVPLTGGQNPAMTGTYSITGTFSATLVFQFSTDNVNWTNIGTYTTTQTALTFVVPGLYRWNCTAYTSGTAVAVIYTTPHIYQQQINNVGTTVFQVDDTGYSGLSSNTVVPGSTIAAQYLGNVNNYFEIYLQNQNSGSSASTDFVATADNGSQTTHYVDLGINSSGGGIAPFTTANEAYVYSSDNILDIGAVGATGTVNVAVGATPTTVLNVDYANGVTVQDVTDPTKKLRFLPSAQTTATVLTLGTGAQTVSRTLNIPVLGGTDTIDTLGTAQTITGAKTFTTAPVTITDQNIVLGTTTGTTIGTATTQKLGFYNASPIVQPTGDVGTALSNLGLVGTPIINATDGLDGTFAINNTADPTKQFKWLLSNQTTGTILTLNSGAQTASRTLAVPVLGANDTIATLASANSFSGIQTVALTTSAGSATTGSLIVGTGTAATSTGIGGGNINTGGTIIAGTNISTTNGNITANTTSGTAAIQVGSITGQNCRYAYYINNVLNCYTQQQSTIWGLFDGVNGAWLPIEYFMGASSAGYVLYNGTLDAASNGTASVVLDGGLYVTKKSFLAGAATIGAATVPSANTFAGNVIWGRNTAAADTAGAVGETITGAFSGVAAAATTSTGNVGSVSLTAGKWLVSGKVVIHSGATGLTSGTTIQCSCPVATAATGTSGTTMSQQSVLDTLTATQLFAMSVDAQVVNISATTSEFLTVNITYGGGSPTIDGSITATRLP